MFDVGRRIKVEGTTIMAFKSSGQVPMSPGRCATAADGIYVLNNSVLFCRVSIGEVSTVVSYTYRSMTCISYISPLPGPIALQSCFVVFDESGDYQNAKVNHAAFIATVTPPPPRAHPHTFVDSSIVDIHNKPQCLSNSILTSRL